MMGGEVVLGGQQDRLLGKDTVIPPHAQKVPVTVFCVEHGRWTGEGRFAGTAKSIGGQEVRLSALEGAFKGEAGNTVAQAAPALTDPVGRPPEAAPSQQSGVAQSQQRVVAGRVAVDAAPVSEAQGKVWASVASKNARFKARPSTGTYRGLLNLDGGEAGKSVEPYLKALSASLKPDPHLAGVAVAINGKVVAADLFGDPVLFRKLWPKLLRSYAADAAEQSDAASARAGAASAAQARAFILNAAKASSQSENRSDVSSTQRLESKDAVTYRVAPSKPGGAGAGGFGGASGAVLHESVIRK